MQRGEIYMYCIDGDKIERSNWLRWLNCPSKQKQQNVNPLYCYGQVYYITSKDIYPQQEMLVYYGDDYAESLGINVTTFDD